MQHMPALSISGKSALTPVKARRKRTSMPITTGHGVIVIDGEALFYDATPQELPDGTEALVVGHDGLAVAEVYRMITGPDRPHYRGIKFVTKEGYPGLTRVMVVGRITGRRAAS